MEAGDSVSSLRRQRAPLLGLGTCDPGDFAEDADPAAAPDGSRWDRPSHRPSSGSTQGRILPDALGTGPVPGARRIAEMGGTARRDV